MPALRERVVVLVLRDLVAGNVEAGGVGQVVDVEGVLEGVAFGEVGDLDQRGIGALLEGLAEDVALAGGEVGLVGIVGGNGAARGCRR